VFFVSATYRICLAAIGSVGKSVRRPLRIIFVIIAATCVSTPVRGQSPDDSLRIYAVNVVKTTPFENPFTGYGVYLGKGAVITAAHVIGRWGFLKNPHVLIAGQNLPAKIIKEGSVEQVDLTLLSVDEERLPVGLRLRQNPLCKQQPQVGQIVIVVIPEKIEHTKIVSPLVIAPQFRKRFSTLSDLVGASGSGVFDTERRCLMGIMSRKATKYDYRKEDGRIFAEPTGFAGYFVPASEIADFVPPEFRF
jgi:hypothetical protein